MREVAKVLAFHAPDETAPEETRGPEETAPEETRGPEAEGDSDLKEPGEPDSAEAVDLDAASTGMVMLLRLTLDAMKAVRRQCPQHAHARRQSRTGASGPSDR